MRNDREKKKEAKNEQKNSLMKTPRLLTEILTAIVLADLISGLFHWIEDAYFGPLFCTDHGIFSAIARDNEMHHYFPRSILAYSYWDHLTVVVPFWICMLAPIAWIYPKWAKRHWVFLSVLFVMVSMSNIFHRFAHMRDCENHVIVRYLQAWGILQSHDHHSRHHTIPSSNYCVILPWNNYWLDSLQVWHGLEKVVAFFTGIHAPGNLTYFDYKSARTHLHEETEKADAASLCPTTPTLADVEWLSEQLKLFKQC